MGISPELTRAARAFSISAAVGVAAAAGSLALVAGLQGSAAALSWLGVVGTRFATAEASAPAGAWPLWVYLLPAIGAGLAGLLARLAPEAAGGGTDAALNAFHDRSAEIPLRALPIKIVASILCLGSGGAGGREGPAMLIGASSGSWLATRLGLGQRERRLLLLAGIAAGISAAFRTPLGGALLAVGIVYRDGSEDEALLPAVVASVTA